MSSEGDDGHGDFAEGREESEEHEHHEGSFSEGQAEEGHDHRPSASGA